MPLFSAQIQKQRRRLVRALMRLLFPKDHGLAGPARWMPRSGIYKILVCRTVHTLGDSLTLTPLLQEIGLAYPGAEVDIINGCPAARGIFGRYVFVRRIFQLPTHALRHPLGTLHAINAMRRDRYDLVIDPDPESQSGRLLALKARTTYSLGFAGPSKSGRLTHEIAIPIAPSNKGKMPVYLLRSALGESSVKVEYPPLDIQISPVERRRGKEILRRLNASQSIPSGGKRTIGIYAYATGRKNLSHAWWSRFLHVFEPAVRHYSLIEILPAFGQSLLDSRYQAFYSSDVRKLASVLGNLTLHISADCGLMHLASAAGARTVGIFTTTSSREWGPYGNSSVAIDAAGIAPERVANRVLALLAEQSPCSPSDPVDVGVPHGLAPA